MKSTPVTGFMNLDPVTARADMSLVELVEQLERHAVRAMAVTDHEGRLVGVVSETDLFLKEKGVPFSMEKVPTLLGRVVGRGEIGQLNISKRVTVEEIMTRDVVTVDDSATLEEVTWLMHRRKLSLLPVVSRGALVGEVRRIHVLQLIYRDT
jgi:CBS domain-containing protein